MTILKRKRSGGLLLMGTVAAAVIGISTTTAMANTIKATWTISPGGNVTGTASSPTLKDTKTGTVLTCSTSAVSATLKKGSGQSNPLGSITDIAFENCTGPLGLTFTVTIGKLPYKLNGTSYKASTGVTKGNITGISASISGSDCSASVAGTTATAKGKVTGSYTNSKGTLTTSGGNLHIWNVNGCAGLIANSDPASFSASYSLSPKQIITSP